MKNVFPKLACLLGSVLVLTLHGCKQNSNPTAKTTGELGPNFRVTKTIEVTDLSIYPQDIQTALRQMETNGTTKKWSYWPNNTAKSLYIMIPHDRNSELKVIQLPSGQKILMEAFTNIPPNTITSDQVKNETWRDILFR